MELVAIGAPSVDLDLGLKATQEAGDCTVELQRRFTRKDGAWNGKFPLWTETG